MKILRIFSLSFALSISAICVSGYDNMSLPLRLKILQEDKIKNTSRKKLIPVNIVSPTDGAKFISVHPDSMATLSSKYPNATISYPRPLSACMDMLRQDINADPLHQASLQLPDLTGKGVIIGVIDKSIQPDHAAFLDENGLPTRIARLYQTVSGAESQDGTLSYTLYSTPQEILNAPIEGYSDGHGTHTASIAAGGFAYAPLRGVAPEAELVLVSGGNNIYEDEIAFGMREIADYAESVGKRCVISISLSGVMGPHDGTGFINSITRELSERGVIICFSAGNSGFALGAIRSKGERISTVIEQLYNRAPSPRFETEAWSIDDTPLRIRFHVIDKNYKEIERTDWISPASDSNSPDYILGVSDSVNTIFPNLSKYFRGDLYALGQVNPENNRYCLSLFYADPADNNSRPTWLLDPEEFALGISIEGVGQSVPFDLFCDHGSIFEDRLQPGFINGSPFQNVNDFITTESVVGVGSYNLRHSWKTLNGDDMSIRPQYDGEPEYPAIYSSFGENPDGDIIPHILAPGTSVIAAFNANCPSIIPEYTHSCSIFNKTHYWGAMTGTSMATPAVAGVIALWLQAAPQASLNDIFDTMRHSSRYDNQFLSSPHKARFGKIDALAGALHIANLSSVETISSNMTLQTSVFNGELEVHSPLPAIFTLSLPSGQILASTSSPAFEARIPTSVHGIVILTATHSKGYTAKKIIIP